MRECNGHQQQSCCAVQTGTGLLAQNPTTASMVKYGTAANSLTQTATGTSEVKLAAPCLHDWAHHP